MPRTASFDQDALAKLLHKQHGVIADDQAQACGMPRHLVRYRARGGGPWQMLAPGVYLTNTGTPSIDQRDMAGLLYSGADSVITASAALRRHCLTPIRGDVVDLLIPATRHRRDLGFVRVHRTRRMPEMFCVAGEIRYALPPRAVADTVWGLTDLSQVRAIVAESVQTGRCHIARLAEELAAGPMRGSARLRQVIAEVSVGVRSVAEAELHELIEWAGLPMPMFNPRLFVGKEFIGSPDCWWPGAGVAVEVDSKAWHLSPQDWEKTLARHALMSAHGIVVLHFTPRQIRTQRQTVAARIQSSLTSDRSHPLPHIKALPAH